MTPVSYKDLPDLCTVQQIRSLNPELWTDKAITEMCRSGQIKAIRNGRKWFIPLRPLLKQFGVIEPKKVRVIKRANK